MSKFYLVVDIGGTHIKYGILNDQREFCYKKTIDTNALLGGKLLIQQVIDIAKQLRNEYDFDRIAIATAGQVNPFTGEIIYASNAIPDYIGLNIKEMIAEQIDVLVSVENDVNCALLAELVNIPEHKNVVMVTVGTGIGGALYINDRLVVSPSFSAGEVGYMSVNSHPFQDEASISALIIKAQSILRVSKINGKELFDLANKNREIKELIDKFYDNLAQGFANIIYLVAPDYLIIGGAISTREEFINEINNRLKKVLPAHIYENMIIKRAVYNNDAGMIGAYYQSECDNNE